MILSIVVALVIFFYVIPPLVDLCESMCEWAGRRFWWIMGAAGAIVGALILRAYLG